MAQHPDKLRWRNELRFGLSASEFGKALGFCGRVVDYVHYRRTIVGTENEFIGNVATFHGIRTEPKSRALYEMLTSCEVNDGGFFTMPDRLLACSPDGQVFYHTENIDEYHDSTDAAAAAAAMLLREEPQRLPNCITHSRQHSLRLLEIKSPFHALYGARREEHQPFGIPLHYMCQIQGQMAIADADECDFFIYLDSNEYCAVEAWRVYKSDTFWAWAEPKLRIVSQWIREGVPTDIPRHFNFDPFDFNTLDVTPLIFPYNLTTQEPLCDSIEFAFFERFASPYKSIGVNHQHNNVTLSKNNTISSSLLPYNRSNNNDHNAGNNNNCNRNIISNYRYKSEVEQIASALRSPVVHFLFGRCKRESDVINCHHCEIHIHQDQKISHKYNVQTEKKNIITNTNKSINSNKNRSLYQQQQQQQQELEQHELIVQSRPEFTIYELCATVTSSLFIKELEMLRQWNKLCALDHNISDARNNDKICNCILEEREDNVRVVIFEPLEWDSGVIYIQLLIMSKDLSVAPKRVENYRIRAFHRSIFASLVKNKSINTRYSIEYPLEMFESKHSNTEQELLFLTPESEEVLEEEEEQEQEKEWEQEKRKNEEEYQEEQKDKFINEEATNNNAQIKEVFQPHNESEQEEEEEEQEKEELSEAFECDLKRHFEENEEVELLANEEEEQQQQEQEERTHCTSVFSLEHTTNKHAVFPLSSSSSSLITSSSTPLSSPPSSMICSQETNRRKNCFLYSHSLHEFEQEQLQQQEAKKQLNICKHIENNKWNTQHDQDQRHAIVTNAINGDKTNVFCIKEREKELPSSVSFISCTEMFELVHHSTTFNEVVIIRDIHLPVQHYPCGADSLIDNNDDDNVNDLVDSDEEEVVILNLEENKATCTLLIAAPNVLLYICKILSSQKADVESVLGNGTHVEDENAHLSLRMYALHLARNSPLWQDRSKMSEMKDSCNKLIMCCVPQCMSTVEIAKVNNDDELPIKNVIDNCRTLHISCLLVDTTNCNNISCVFDKIVNSLHY